MTRIRTVCPDCGEVEVDAQDMSLHLMRDTKGDLTDASWFGFDCPGCDTLVRKPVDARIAGLLISGGVPVRDQADAALVAHPENPPVGPAFTPDDLIDLHLLLDRTDWFDRLRATVA